MELLKQIRLGVGFLIAVSAPPYLLYDFHKISQGRTSLFHCFMFVLVVCLLGACALWLSRLRGSDYMRLKPLWERPAAFMMLIFSTPVLLISAILIRLESSGPAVYSQERIGEDRRKRQRRRAFAYDRHHPLWNSRKGDRRQDDLGGKPFIIYKLRSMGMNAEEDTGAAWSTGDRDPRVTKAGYYLRKTHIDELPQLYNVLLGQMSIIGPRPERPDFIAQLSGVIEGYRERLSGSPGITGLAQVRQEHDESLEDVKKKLQHDREYIRNACLSLDIQIVLETIVLMFNMFWNALKRRTIRTVEPKTPDTLIPEDGQMERG